MSEYIDKLLKDYSEANDMSFAGIITKLILPAITHLDQRLDTLQKHFIGHLEDLVNLGKEDE